MSQFINNNWHLQHISILYPHCDSWASHYCAVTPAHQKKNFPGSSLQNWLPEVCKWKHKYLFILEKSNREWWCKDQTFWPHWSRYGFSWKEHLFNCYIRGWFNHAYGFVPNNNLLVQERMGSIKKQLNLDASKRLMNKIHIVLFSEAQTAGFGNLSLKEQCTEDDLAEHEPFLKVEW